MRYSSTQSLFCALTFAFSHLPSALAFEQCYYADGSIPTDYLWEPCVSQTNVNFSSCCVPSEGDICQADGLCFYPGVGENDDGATYRGACTDRTWNDPSCNADICLTGFENTWIWATECKSGSQITWACGNITDNAHNPPLPCPANEVAVTDWVTTTSTSSVGRYTPPPSVNTKIFTVRTSSYTITMTANAQTATLTTTFESTFTSALSPSTSGSTAAEATSNSPSASNSPTSDTKKSGLGLGAIIAIIAIPVVLIAIGIGLFFFFRAKRSKAEDGLCLNSAVPPPPPNGPVGADQVYPYEAAGNEVNRPQHNYYGPKVDTFEIDDRNAVSRTEKSPAVYGANGYQNGAGQQRAELNSPAPAYSYGGPIAVEMDATPVIRYQAP